ncbi:MAG: DsbA family protein, partial [Balneolales bacterium]|nr:DsbA family protein [Balneolales bacterium]
MSIEIEIWSDIVCPFCYIGKRNFEKALSESGSEQNVHVTWRSFELALFFNSYASSDIYTYLAERKGWSNE